MSNLLKKGNFNTDKSRGYLLNYEMFLSHKRENDTKLLELGVFKGGSLLMWGDYFKKGTIVGVDIDKLEIELPQNVHFKLGDQRDKEFLESITKKYTKGGFDVIIDDASHFGNFTEASFLICFNRLLKPGGVYVIEDWGTGYWSDWPDGEKFHLSEDHIISKLHEEYTLDNRYEAPYKKSYCSHNIGMVGLGKQLIDELAINDIKHSNEEISHLKRMIHGINFSNGQIFIMKNSF